MYICIMCMYYVRSMYAYMCVCIYVCHELGSRSQEMPSFDPSPVRVIFLADKVALEHTSF
jgi:hypothetical protein